MIRIGINGLGRVGRTLLRQAVMSDDLQVVGVNDLADARMLRTLLRRDSTFAFSRRDRDRRRLARHRRAQDPGLPRLDAGRACPGASSPSMSPECTGKFRSGDTAGGHLEAGARKVVISAPGKGVDATFVMGVNDQDYQPGHHDVVSNASCTTNCVAPMVKVLHEAFGVQHGFMSTVHAYTGDQNLLDAPHKDERRARSAAVNIIPTTTGAAKASGRSCPSWPAALDGVALRVPVDGSLVDLAVLLDREVTVAEVNAAFEAAAMSPGCAAGFATKTVRSSRWTSSATRPRASSTRRCRPPAFVKVFGWYDNEWGYTARLVELTRLRGTTPTTPSGHEARGAHLRPRRPRRRHGRGAVVDGRLR